MSFVLRFCVYNFWNMQIARSVLLIYFLVMLTLGRSVRQFPSPRNGLMLYTDFHYQVEGKSESVPSKKVSIAFDSSGWMQL